MRRRTSMTYQAFSVDVARATSAAPVPSCPISPPTRMNPYIGIALFAATTESYPGGRTQNGTGSLPPRQCLRPDGSEARVCEKGDHFDFEVNETVFDARV